MDLSYLEFDFTEDAQGRGSFDAMAAVSAAHLPALSAEIAHVLHWAHQAFGPALPLDDGGEWDHELRGSREMSTRLDAAYDPGAGSLKLCAAGPALETTTLNLTISGTPGFCEGFRDAFNLS